MIAGISQTLPKITNNYPTAMCNAIFCEEYKQLALLYLGIIFRETTELLVG
jgi:hypothetical protein